MGSRKSKGKTCKHGTPLHLGCMPCISEAIRNPKKENKSSAKRARKPRR